MGMKESMMDKMMGKMSKEEKAEMMNQMMGNFFEGMSEEEKQNMMSGMMGKMMGGGSSPMGGMMQMMMGGKSGGGSPMDMCRKMMEGMSESKVTAQYATPELRGLFEEWVVQLEEEVLTEIEKQSEIDIQKLQKAFSLKEESIQWILSSLAKKSRIHYSI